MTPMKTLADARERMSDDFEIVNMLALMAEKKYGVEDAGDLIYDDVRTAKPDRLLDMIIHDAVQRILQP